MCAGFSGSVERNAWLRGFTGACFRGSALGQIGYRLSGLVRGGGSVLGYGELSPDAIAISEVLAQTFPSASRSSDPLRVSNICRDLGHIVVLLTSKVLGNHRLSLGSEEVRWNWLCGVPLTGCFQTPKMSFARPLPRLGHNFARFPGPLLPLCCLPSSPSFMTSACIQIALV